MYTKDENLYMSEIIVPPNVTANIIVVNGICYEYLANTPTEQTHDSEDVTAEFDTCEDCSSASLVPSSSLQVVSSDIGSSISSLTVSSNTESSPSSLGSISEGPITPLPLLLVNGTSVELTASIPGEDTTYDYGDGTQDTPIGLAQHTYSTFGHYIVGVDNTQINNVTSLVVDDANVENVYTTNIPTLEQLSLKDVQALNIDLTTLPNIKDIALVNSGNTQTTFDLSLASDIQAMLLDNMNGIATVTLPNVAIDLISIDIRNTYSLTNITIPADIQAIDIKLINVPNVPGQQLADIIRSLVVANKNGGILDLTDTLTLIPCPAIDDKGILESRGWTVIQGNFESCDSDSSSYDSSVLSSEGTSSSADSSGISSPRSSSDHSSRESSGVSSLEKSSSGSILVSSGGSLTSSKEPSSLSSIISRGFSSDLSTKSSFASISESSVKSTESSASFVPSAVSSLLDAISSLGSPDIPPPNPSDESTTDPSNPGPSEDIPDLSNRSYDLCESESDSTGSSETSSTTTGPNTLYEICPGQ